MKWSSGWHYCPDARRWRDAPTFASQRPPRGEDAINLPDGNGRDSLVPDALLRVTVQGNVFAGNMAAYLFAVDSREISLPGVGTHAVPVRSGRRSLHVYSRSPWRYGEVEMELDVAPGQTIDIYYAPPHHGLAPGAMGLTPLRRNGLGAVIGFAIVAVVVVFVLGVLMPTVELLSR
jgi:hypothetical protein